MRHVDRTTLLIPTEPSWDDLKTLLLSASRHPRGDLQYFAKSMGGTCDERSTICVFANHLTGAAAYEIDVHWNGHTLLGDDAVGFRVAKLIEHKIILRNFDEKPTRWMMLSPEYEIWNLLIDEELLNEQRVVCYSIV